MKKIVLLILLFSLMKFSSAGNEKIILLSNLTKSSSILKENRIDFFNHLTSNPNTTLVLLGDCNIQEEEIMSFLKEVKNENIKLLYLPGDKDWESTKKNGIVDIEQLEIFINNKLGKKILFPSSGCPGPKVISESEDLIIVGINSQWWLQKGRKQMPVDSDCKSITNHQISEGLDDIIKESEGKQVLVLGHHPLFSSGLYGGGNSLKAHVFPGIHDNPDDSKFLPIYGTFYHYFRQNSGTKQDRNNESYQLYVNTIIKAIEPYHNVIYASGHEYNSQLHNVDGNFHLNAGASDLVSRVSKDENLLFQSVDNGFVEIIVDKGWTSINFFNFSGNIDSQYSQRIIRKEEHTSEIKAPFFSEEKSTIITAGDYNAGFFKRMFLGSLYRNSWTAPVKINYLDMDTTFGGLTAYSLGGGRQTTSLKLRNEKGETYVFRSVDKNPVKALPLELRGTFIERLSKDMTATQHPYGAVVVSKLLDNTSILHASPKLYVLPSSKNLGEWNEKYSGLFGMLEEKPWEESDKKDAFGGADKIVNTLDLFGKMYNSPKHRIDTTEYLRARVFDIMIGDWGRHEDNWKWAAYKKGDLIKYRPIPRDRDHVFSRWNGLLPFLADRKWARPNTENFGKNYSDIQSLTWQNRHYDRYLLSSATKEDFNDATNYILESISEEDINEAIKELPVEIIPISGEEIKEKLINRRISLVNAAEKYYRILAKQVDVVGTNKKEVFTIIQSNDSVRVIVKSVKQDVNIYDRTFTKKETQEIKIYGLDGADSFNISGQENPNIKIRIMPGEGKDNIELENLSSEKNIIVYSENEIETGEKLKVVQTSDPYYTEFNRTKFKYNTYLPYPIISSSVDDGVRIGGGINYTRQGYDYKDYKAKYGFNVSSSSNNSLLINAHLEHYIPRSNWTVGASVKYGDYFSYYNFYGLGNNSIKIDSLDDSDYYLTRLKGVFIEEFVTYKFLKNSSFRLSLNQDLLEDETNFNVADESMPTGSVIARNTLGSTQSLDLDFTNSKSFTSKGIQLKLNHVIYVGTEFENSFGKIDASLAHYSSFKALLPITLRLEGGFQRTYGDDIPYYYLPSLGYTTKLRGYLSNRFTGSGMEYLNSDLRIHLGKSKSNILPVYYGVNLFADLGRINDGDSSNDSFHTGYGAGIYLAPISKDLITIQLNIASSEEESLLFRFGIGLFLK